MNSSLYYYYYYCSYFYYYYYYYYCTARFKRGAVQLLINFKPFQLNQINFDLKPMYLKQKLNQFVKHKNTNNNNTKI